MKRHLFHFSLPFNISILVAVMLVLIPLSATLFAVGWYAVDMLQTDNIRLKIARAEENVTLLLVERISSVDALQRQLATRPEIANSPGGNDVDSIARWRILNTFIEPFPSLTSAYVGYKDGGFAQASVLARYSPERQREINAPPGATRALWLISFNTGVRKESWFFFDDAGNIIGRAIDNRDYDPRTRLWYQAALELHRQTMTDPYPFAQHGGIGITAAMPLPRENGVLGADFSLASLSTVLREYNVSPSAQMNVMTDVGDLLADSILDPTNSSISALVPRTEQQLHDAMVRAIWDLRKKVAGGDSKTLKIGGASYLVLARALPPTTDKHLFLTIAIPSKELTVESDALLKWTAIIALITIAAAIVIVGFVSRTLARALGRLAQQTQRFRRLDFSDSTIVRSRVTEISRLAEAVERMRSGLELFGHYIPIQIVRRLLES